MVTRIASEIEDYVLELGNDGRLLSLQLDELVTGVDADRQLVVRDYLPTGKRAPTTDDALTALGALGPTASWANVVSLKTHFITRSLDKAISDNVAAAQEFQLGGIGAVSTAHDGYTRKAYSNAIRLVNPSAVRELQ
jgi:DNA integrity scanning protein DisA with diadenylate cyclase activity